MTGQKTYIYVDGFNLYFGSLRKTPYKWLDLKTLFQNLLDEQHEIIAIKYFTALISGRDDLHSPLRQQTYLRALEAYIPEVSIYYGHYLTNKTTAKLCKPNPNQSPYVRIYKTEEKGSDVNLALHILNDAWLNLYDCAILVSNDSDIAEALNMVKKQNHKKVGLIVPGDKTRRTSAELARHADFIKRIREGILSNSQLPITNYQLPITHPHSKYQSQKTQ